MVKVIFDNNNWRGFILRNNLSNKTLANYYLSKTSKDITLSPSELNFMINELYCDLLNNHCLVFQEENGRLRKTIDQNELLFPPFEIVLKELDDDTYLIRLTNQRNDDLFIEHSCARHRIPTLKTGFMDIDNTTGNIVFEITYLVESAIDDGAIIVRDH